MHLSNLHWSCFSGMFATLFGRSCCPTWAGLWRLVVRRTHMRITPMVEQTWIGSQKSQRCAALTGVESSFNAAVTWQPTRTCKLTAEPLCLCRCSSKSAFALHPPVVSLKLFVPVECRSLCTLPTILQRHLVASVSPPSASACRRQSWEVESYQVPSALLPFPSICVLKCIQNTSNSDEAYSLIQTS